MKRCFFPALLLLATTFGTPATAWAASCGAHGIAVQVLGSGGPELDDGRASSGYLVWRDGQAQVLVDLGPGSLLHYETSGARLADLQVILLSHLHVDHSADLPALIKGSFFTPRHTDLPLYGPIGNGLMPPTTEFAADLFGTGQGAFRYLDGYLHGGEAYRLLPHDVAARGRQAVTVLDDARFRITAIPVHHGPVPALAWRVEIGGYRVVFSGDMNGDYDTLPRLAAGADLLVAHNAIPETARGVARRLHMPPSVIGRIAGQAKVKSLVLSHRMQRTLGREADTQRLIRVNYTGPLAFAEDGQCFPVTGGN
jgi:ribonuclease BN (tRNA processing enzyme)